MAQPKAFAAKATDPSRAGRHLLWRRLWRIFRRNKVESLGVIVVLVVIFIAIFGPSLLPFDPERADMANAFKPPGGKWLLGTDQAGRDVFSRILAGTRHSLWVAVRVLATAVTAGVIIGAVAGWRGGWTDDILMRMTDIFLAFPPLVLAMALAVAFGSGLTSAAMATAATWWPGYARIVRSRVLSVKNLDYVEAARSLGAPSWWILARHVVPNSVTPLTVQVSLDVGYVILTTAGLSFIGVGAQPPLPEWGAMIAGARDYVQSHWWVMLFPGLALFITVVSFNLVGDLLRNELDPTLRRHT